MNESLYGLILCGGLSSRLGQDKYLLLKDNKPLYKWWLDQLNPFCNKVFISCRKEQIPKIKSDAIIPDQSDDTGPLEGIYRAFQNNNQVNWLVVAVDLVFINELQIQNLISHNQAPYDAIAYRNPNTGDPFPLCSIYRISALPEIESQYYSNLKSPRLVLQSLNTLLLEINEPKSLEGINTRMDFELWNHDSI